MFRSGFFFMNIGFKHRNPKDALFFPLNTSIFGNNVLKVDAIDMLSFKNFLHV